MKLAPGSILFASILFAIFDTYKNLSGPESRTGGLSTGVCSYVQKHVIKALEGFSQFSAKTWKTLLGLQ